jgi:hypothetical protein
MVYGLRAGDPIEWLPNDPAAGAPFLEAGAALTVTGPNGPARIGRTETGVYSAALGGAGGSTEYLGPGQYAVSNGSGGADVGPFQAELVIPPPIAWQNADTVKDIVRAQPLRVSWSGGDASREFVVIVGAATVPTTQAVGSFVCAERVDSGQFTIPAEVLSALPAASAWTSDGYPTGLLSVGTLPVLSAVRFPAPGLDAGYFSYSRQELRNVNYK